MVLNLFNPSCHSSSNKALQTLSEFQAQFPKFLDLIFAHEADDGVGLPCQTCPNKSSPNLQTTHCHDCHSYPISCLDCFIATHLNLPTHWANVWDFSQGFFIHHDIALLRDDIAAINLGHHGHPCPSAYATNVIFTLVNTNGIHKTKIWFCSCVTNNRSEQLMRAWLFPATIPQPTTAFTFHVLQQFHIHHLESQESVYDFVSSLCRLTDNAFAYSVPMHHFHWFTLPHYLFHLHNRLYTHSLNLLCMYGNY